MKKLIAISVVLALATFSAFADVGGTVIGSINVLESGDEIMGSGGMSRLRLEGSGANEDGTFGAWLRVNAGSQGGSGSFFGIGWWKPIDQLKISLGGNPDGIFGKEGVSGWSYQQMVSDVCAYNGGLVWGWGAYNNWIVTRQAFYNGFDGAGLLLEIKPLDILGINIALPYIGDSAKELKEIFKSVHAQIDVNLDFGNIALTYRGGAAGGFMGESGAGSLFVYFGLSAIENIGLDVGFRYVITGDDDVAQPVGIGLAAKIGISDQFGIKARVITTLAGDNKEFNLLFGVLPYFAISSNLKAFLDFALIMNKPDSGDSTIGWHINPYLEIGAEWFPTFYVGFKAHKAGDADLGWSLPIGIGVNF